MMLVVIFLQSMKVGIGVLAGIQEVQKVVSAIVDNISDQIPRPEKTVKQWILNPKVLYYKLMGK